MLEGGCIMDRTARWFRLAVLILAFALMLPAPALADWDLWPEGPTTTGLPSLSRVPSFSIPRMPDLSSRPVYSMNDTSLSGMSSLPSLHSIPTFRPTIIVADYRPNSMSLMPSLSGIPAFQPLPGVTDFRLNSISLVPNPGLTNFRLNSMGLVPNPGLTNFRLNSMGLVPSPSLTNFRMPTMPTMPTIPSFPPPSRFP